MLEYSFSRTDRSLLGNWWWTVDRWVLFLTIALFFLGFFLSFSASPSVAHTINLPTFYFVKRHFLFMILAMGVMGSISLASPKLIYKLCWGLLVICLLSLILTPLLGMEIKGARRWLNVGGFSFQASEFAKPVFFVITAWILNKHTFYFKKNNFIFTQTGLSILFYLLLVLLIVIQPDFGMTFILSSVWFIQMFLSGISLVWVYALALLGSIGSVASYYIFPHIASRVDRFLNPAEGDQFQILKSLSAFKGGGWFGRGPGEGLIKKNLPDAHADFVFSVVGEEFGFFTALLILFLFIALIARCFYRAYQEKTRFISIALVGLTCQIALQLFVNVGSSLHLIPTKGMTLPFLSYGGSSLLSTGLLMGMILSFTRKRIDSIE